jgi:hypothetical protein
MRNEVIKKSYSLLKNKHIYIFLTGSSNKVFFYSQWLKKKLT